MSNQSISVKKNLKSLVSNLNNIESIHVQDDVRREITIIKRKLDDIHDRILLKKLESINTHMALHASPGLWDWVKNKIIDFFKGFLDNMGGWSGILESIGSAFLKGVGKALANILKSKIDSINGIIKKYTKGWVDLSSFFNKTMAGALNSIDGLIKQNQNILSSLTSSFTSSLASEFSSQNMIFEKMPFRQALAQGELFSSQTAALSGSIEDLISG